MLSTRFTALVGCSVPIQQAGMGGLASPRLAAAVANAGGLGMVSALGARPAVIAERLRTARALANGTIGVNFIMRGVAADEVEASVAAAARGADLVEFFYSDPDPSLVDLVHQGDALACWQIGSREEAVAAAAAGCDLIVAQGYEAGGHVRGTIGLLAMLADVLDAVGIPVLAAGGIGTGRQMAAALAAGADGVRVGTRFIAAEEARAHPIYLDALLAARAEDTVYTTAFSVGWPDAPHRVLRSSLSAAQAFEGDVVGERVRDGVRMPVQRFECVTALDGDTGAIDAMSLWAGESVGAVRRLQSAAEIVRELTEEAQLRLEQARGFVTIGAG